MILFFVDDTMTTKFTRRACAVHCNSLPVVVDKVVVVVFKFYNIVKRSETIKDSYGSGRRFNKIVIRRNSFSTNNNKKTSIALFTLCVFAFFAKKT